MTSGEIYHPKRNKPMIINPREHPELANEFFNLISIAYSSIGGHVYVKSPEDVFSDPAWNWWQGEDIHGSPDFDLISEFLMVAEGFTDARLLARKFITLYSLCKELLSKQVNFFFSYFTILKL